MRKSSLRLAAVREEAGTFLQRLSSICSRIPATLGTDIDAITFSTGCSTGHAGQISPDLSSERFRAFRACQELMNSCKLTDLIHPDALSGFRDDGRWRLSDLLRENVCIQLLHHRGGYVGESIATIDFDVAAFVIPAGGVMPIHGHKGMVVSSKVVYGQLDLTSFHVVPAHASAPVPAAVNNTGLLSVEMSKKRLTAADSAWFLAPAYRNIHQFAAAGDEACVVLDVLLPPYDDTRSCDFFEIASSTDISQVGTECVNYRRALLREIPMPNHLLPYAVSYP